MVLVGSENTTDWLSWPPSGEFCLDGLTYNTINQPDVRTRIAWLRRQARSNSLSLQLYEKLALTLRQNGHEHDARDVSIARQSAYGKTHFCGGIVHSWSQSQGSRVLGAGRQLHRQERT
jgi:hypothetical protein